MPRACPERSPRGGPRPNSGPPKGNLNAFKHGRTSRHYQRLLQLIAADPQARDMLMAVARRNRSLQQKAQREANLLLDTLTRRLHERARWLANARYENDQRIPPLPDTESPFEQADF